MANMQLESRKGNEVPEEWRDLPEGVKAERMRNCREVLGWTDTTSYVDKVQDVQLLSATGYDYKFVSIHHDMRALMDTYKNESDLEAFDYNNLYSRISLLGDKKAQKEIILNRINESGGATGKSVDLFKMVKLRKIQEINSYLPKPFSDGELQRKVYAGEPIICDFIDPKDKTHHYFDLQDKVPEMEISAEELQYYLNVIEGSQTQFQMLSNYRGDAIDIHHAENAGHCQMKTIAGKSMYIPVGIEDAKAYVRADVNKTDSAFRAKGYSHEIGWYEENTSTLVKIEADAYRLFRGGITNTRVHEKSDTRMLSNIVALSSGEYNTSVNKAEMSFHFGNGGKGKIYSAMRHHYDRKMALVDRKGITNEEIGDKIVTDIVGVMYATNYIDWLMSFATASGISTRESIITPDAVNGSKGTGKGNWERKPVFIFDAKRIKNKEEYTGEEISVDEPESNIECGKVVLRGIPALTQYIQWRISRGEVLGISKDSHLATEGVSKEKQAKENGEVDKKEEENAEETAKVTKWSEQFTQAFSELMKNVFGENAISFVQGIIDGSTMTNIKMKNTDGSEKSYDIGSEKGLHDFISDRLKKSHIQADTKLNVGVDGDRDDLSQKMVEQIKAMRENSRIGSKGNQKISSPLNENARKLLERLKS